MKKPTQEQIKSAALKTEKVVTSPAFLKLAGVAVGIYLIYKVITKAGDIVTPDAPTNNLDLTDVAVPDPSKTTITEAQAKIHAQTLLEASDRYPYGTYDDMILSVFKKINADDFKMIFKAFGMRLYNDYNSPPESWFWQQLDNYTDRNLVYWLRSELSDSKGTEVYNLVKKIVEEAGFTF